MAEILTLDDFEQELEGMLHPRPKWSKLEEIAESLGEASQVDALREALELGAEDEDEDPVDEFFGEFCAIVSDNGFLLVPVGESSYEITELSGRFAGIKLPEFSSDFQQVKLDGVTYAIVTDIR